MKEFCLGQEFVTHLSHCSDFAQFEEFRSLEGAILEHGHLKIKSNHDAFPYLLLDLI